MEPATQLLADKHNVTVSPVGRIDRSDRALASWCMMRNRIRDNDKDRDDETKFSGVATSLIHDQLPILEILRTGGSRDDLPMQLLCATISQVSLRNL